MAERDSDPGFSLISWQLMVRGFVVAGFSYLYTAYVWSELTPYALATGGGLILAGIIGLAGAWRTRPSRRWWLRLADGGVDILGGAFMVATAIAVPLVSLNVFAVWAVVAGGLLIVHALPTRFQDAGRAWAWTWTGLLTILLGAFTLLFPDHTGPSTALLIGALGLIGATLIILLGMDLTDPEILKLPVTEAPAESHFTCNDLDWRKVSESPPEEPRKTA